MKTTKTAEAAALDAVLALINNTGGPTAGSLKIYDGSVPANLAATPAGTVLANCVLGNASAPAFTSTSSSTLTATGNTSGGFFAQDPSAANTGTATYWRLCDYTGAARLQGTIGTSSAELLMSTLSIVAGYAVTINTFNCSISGMD